MPNDNPNPGPAGRDSNAGAGPDNDRRFDPADDVLPGICAPDDPDGPVGFAGAGGGNLILCPDLETGEIEV